MHKNLSFSGKIILLLIAIMLITMSIFILIMNGVIHKSVSSQMENDGEILINAIKREIEGYDIHAYDFIQQVFSDTKQTSNGGIAYISLSNSDGALLVTDETIYGIADAVSAASETEAETTDADDTSDTNRVLEDNTGAEVYNISEELSNGEGILNIGLSLEAMNAQIASAILSVIIFGVGITCLVIFIGAFVTRVLLKELNKTREGLDVLSKGDLTIGFQSKSKDEFGKLAHVLNHFVNALRETISETKHSIEDFKQITNTLGDSRENLSETTEKVVQLSEQIDGVLAHQNQMIDALREQFESFAQLILHMSSETSKAEESNQAILSVSALGNEQLQALVGAMEDMVGSFDDGTKRIVQLNNSVEDITHITGVINGVAQQTNLLALNASIEAARAGAEGKGFAVVAEEIKKLAEQVIASSTKIDESIMQMKEIVVYVTTSNQVVARKLEDQKVFVTNTVESFSKIQAQVDHNANNLEALGTIIGEVDHSKGAILKRLDEVSTVALNAKESGTVIGESIQNQKAVIDEFSQIASRIDHISEVLENSIQIFTV